MKTLQIQLKGKSTDEAALTKLKDWKPQLVLIFGNVSYFQQGALASKIQQFTGASVIGCSSAGEISDHGALDNTLVVTGVQFEKTKFRTHLISSKSIDESAKCGQQLGEKLIASDLKSVIVFGKGVQINGSALIEGLRKAVPENILISGGLAGDSGAFTRTYVVQDSVVESDAIVGLGLYGDAVDVSFGFGGGWEPFGPIRKITKASGTILYELDGEKALNVYKSYLKDFAKDLPASGLLFPFSLLDNTQSSTGLTRTILGIDEKEGSLQLAGIMPEGGFVRLMHTNNNGLVGGATAAAQSAKKSDASGQGLAIAVSCVGRKLVMGEDVDEEIEALQTVLPNCTVTGFYSNGEIGPFRSSRDSQLHNQTMTVTCINEKAS